jgi:hypothetical protein
MGHAPEYNTEVGPPSGDRLKVSDLSVMNSRFHKWMVDVLGELDAEREMCVTGGDGGFT